MLLEKWHAEADVGEAPREAGELDDSHLTEAELFSTQKSSPLDSRAEMLLRRQSSRIAHLTSSHAR